MIRFKLINVFWIIDSTFCTIMKNDKSNPKGAIMQKIRTRCLMYKKSCNIYISSTSIMSPFDILVLKR